MMRRPVESSFAGRWPSNSRNLIIRLVYLRRVKMSVPPFPPNFLSVVDGSLSPFDSFMLPRVANRMQSERGAETRDSRDVNRRFSAVEFFYRGDGTVLPDHPSFSSTFPTQTSNPVLASLSPFFSASHEGDGAALNGPRTPRATHLFGE